MDKDMGPFRDAQALLGSSGPGLMYRLNLPLTGTASVILCALLLNN